MQTETTSLEVALSGADFAELLTAPGTIASGFGGVRLDTNTAEFYLNEGDGWWGKDWAIVTEAHPDGTVLEIVGTAHASLLPSGYSGTFSGSLKQSTRLGDELGSCHSTAFEFSLLAR